MRRRVLVIGGGLAGLCAAVHAARAGAEVTLWEARGAPGGRARTRETRGFRFNLGPHALYRAGEGSRVLRSLGVTPHGVAPRVRGALAHARGRLFALPVGAGSLLATRLLTATDKAALLRWLAALPRLDTAALDAAPLDAALEAQLSAPGARACARALVRLATYAHAPAHQSAGAALRQLADAGQGVMYLDGGFAQLVAALAQMARQAGVRIEPHARAREVEPGAVVQAVGRDGRCAHAEAVVLALGPGEASALVRGGSDPVLRALAGRATPVRAAVLDVGLARLPRPSRTFCLGIDAPTYCAVHSVAADMAPRHAAQLQLARYLAPEEKLERAAVASELLALLDLVQPGWREQVVTRSLATELVVTHALVTAEQGGRAGRPDVAQRHLPGVFHISPECFLRGIGWDHAASSRMRASRAAPRRVAWPPPRAGKRLRVDPCRVSTHLAVPTCLAVPIDSVRGSRRGEDGVEEEHARAVAAAFARHRGALLGLCYRMTGFAADAEDLVQDTFARALAAPPRDLARDLGPWLVRVAMNLCRDHLRRRRRARYIGRWLPEPVPTGGDGASEDGPSDARTCAEAIAGGAYPSRPMRDVTTGHALRHCAGDDARPDARYSLLESCRYAFLVALEALPPAQRGVLLLRDVFEYTSAEAADALGVSPGNARQILHRARAAMSAYDASRALSGDAKSHTHALLARFMAAVAHGDVRAIEALLADDAVGFADGGGRYFAARIPIHGRTKLARVTARLGRLYPEPPEVRVVELNGLPACVGRCAHPPVGYAPAFAWLLTPDSEGHIAATYSVLVPRKVERLVAAAFPAR